jgi:heme-degrading monooxygenase HmoA
MFVAIWEFFVRPGNEVEFESIYGPRGDWAKLFACNVGYQGTELLVDNEYNAEGATRYVTIDRWRSAGDFANFRSLYGERYKELDALCEHLTTREAHLGNFESK